MKLLRAVLPAVVAFIVLWTLSVYAKDPSQTTNDESPTATDFSVDQTIPISASLTIQVEGKTYIVAVPATLRVDTSQMLNEARMTIEDGKRIGSFEWTFVFVGEREGEYTLDNGRSISPSSSDTKLVVVRSSAVNLDSEPINFGFQTSGQFAYDELGNTYEISEYSCDEMNPGVAGTCEFVFEVPVHANILGLDMTVEDHRRMPFESASE